MEMSRRQIKTSSDWVLGESLPRKIVVFVRPVVRSLVMQQSLINWSIVSNNKFCGRSGGHLVQKL